MSLSTQLRIPAFETEFVDIPTTPLLVSRVALGTWAMGGWMWGGTDQRESVATIRAALDQGINLIDTAPVYGFGTSEEIVGAALQGVRKHAVIATKVGVEWRDGKVYRNATRARIFQEVDESLRRLRTDYIDIYQVHWPDPLVPVEETAEAMRLLCEQGKIRAIGVSNFSVAEMERFRRVAPLHVVQSPYNLFERAIEGGDPALRSRQSHRDLRLRRALPRPAERAHAPGHQLRRRRSAAIDPKFQSPRFLQYLEAVRQLDSLAQGRFHRSVIHLAVRWMLDQGISVALWGGRHPQQVEATLGVAGWSLNAAQRGLIENIVNATVVDPVGPEFMAPPQRP